VNWHKIRYIAVELLKADNLLFGPVQYQALVVSELNIKFDRLM
jgi:hypothetical protein